VLYQGGMTDGSPDHVGKKRPGISSQRAGTIWRKGKSAKGEGGLLFQRKHLRKKGSYTACAVSAADQLTEDGKKERAETATPWRRRERDSLGCCSSEWPGDET